MPTIETPKPATQAAHCPTDGPDRRLISRVAKVVGSLPKDLIRGRRRSLRKWSGFLESRRTYVGQPVILPDGSDASLVWVRRGVVEVEQLDDFGEPVRLRLPGDRVRLFQNPAAVLLGKQKLGKSEQRSALKAETCRENGKRPVRPGHRRRGRPSANEPPWRQFVLKSRSKPLRGLSVDALLARVIETQSELQECIRHDEERRAKKMARAVANGLV
jgi:hypothetical protein